MASLWYVAISFALLLSSLPVSHANKDASGKAPPTAGEAAAYMESIRPLLTKALFSAIHKGNATTVGVFLSKPFLQLDAEYRGSTPILAVLQDSHLALEGYNGNNGVQTLDKLDNYHRMLKMLLDKGASPSASCPIFEALLFRNLPALHVLLDAMNATELSRCLTLTDKYHNNALHAVGDTKAAGMAGLLYRMQREENSTVVDAISQHLGLVLGDWRHSLSITRRQLEAALNGEDVELLIAASKKHGLDLWSLLTKSTAAGSPWLRACSNGRRSVVEPLFAVYNGWTTQQQAADCQALASRNGFPRFPTLFFSEDMDGNNGIVTVDDTDAAAEPTQSLEGSPRIRRFDVEAFEKSGWNVASDSELESIGLSSSIWSGDNELRNLLSAARHRSPLKLPAIAMNATIYHHLLLDRPHLISTSFDPVLLKVKRRSNDTDAGYVKFDTMLHQYGGYNVRAGVLPYASTYGAAGHVTSIGKFMRTNMGRNATHTVQVQEHADFVPASPAYVFDGTLLSKDGPALALLAAMPAILEEGRHNMRQLMMGPPLSGSMPHFHGQAANLLLVGVKLWVAVPPGCGFFDGRPAAQWFHSFATGTLNVEQQVSSCVPYIFTQYPGEVVVIPPYWGHAVINLSDSIAVAVE